MTVKTINTNQFPYNSGSKGDHGNKYEIKYNSLIINVVPSHVLLLLALRKYYWLTWERRNVDVVSIRILEEFRVLQENVFFEPVTVDSRDHQSWRGEEEPKFNSSVSNST